MHPHLSELLDLGALDRAVGQGYVREQVHPALPYKILNYTEKAQFERVCNAVTGRPGAGRRCGRAGSGAPVRQVLQLLRAP